VAGQKDQPISARGGSSLLVYRGILRQQVYRCHSVRSIVRWRRWCSSAHACGRDGACAGPPSSRDFSMPLAALRRIKGDLAFPPEILATMLVALATGGSRGYGQAALP
jgi:hypothetical protein